MSDPANTPNVVIPLAMSYDTRNIRSRTSTLAGVDQRKVNCYYEIIRNSVTGHSTLELVKRPGVVAAVSFSGTVGTAYAIKNIVATSPTLTWMIGKSGNDHSVHNSSTSTLILTDGNFQHIHFDSTIISDTVTAVTQFFKDATTAQKVFYASAIGSWTEITDAEFIALLHRGKMEHMDGYAFIMESNNYIHNSDLNSLANWSATNKIRKQIQWDTACGLIKFKDRLFAFGKESCEMFVNTGNPSGSPLSVVKSASEKIGLGHLADPFVGSNSGITSYYTNIGGRLFFLGRIGSAGDYNETLITYNGSGFEPIPSGPLTRILSEGNALYSINSVTFYGKSAVAVQITAPGAATQRAMLYFPDLKEWFEWTSTVWGPLNDGINFVGVAGSSAAYWFDNTNTWTDASTAYTASVQFRLPKRGNNRDFMRWCALDADTTTSASNVTVKFSDDDYQNFDSGRTIDLNTAEKKLTRCGSYKNRAVRLEHSANAEFRARNFLARID